MIQLRNIHLQSTALRLWLAIFAFIALSCQNESRDNASETAQGDPASEIAADIGAPLPALPYIAVFNKESEQLEAQKNADFDQTLLTEDVLTHALRTNYPDVELEVDRISNDTLFVQIVDASYLTQQMGSSGAQMYIMEATYAYTELPGIEVVHFDFAEGDHAIPGNYTRESVSEGHPSR